MLTKRNFELVIQRSQIYAQIDVILNSLSFHRKLRANFFYKQLTKHFNNLYSQAYLKCLLSLCGWEELEKSDDQGSQKCLSSREPPPGNLELGHSLLS